LIINLRKEHGSHLLVSLSHVCKDSQSLLKVEKRVAIELWRAKVPLKAILVKMSKSTLRRILTFAKKNQRDWLLATRLAVEGPLSSTKHPKALRKNLLNSPTTTAKQPKKTVPGLANMSMRATQCVSLKKL
jgi:hypothetical protein